MKLLGGKSKLKKKNIYAITMEPRNMGNIHTMTWFSTWPNFYTSSHTNKIYLDTCRVSFEYKTMHTPPSDTLNSNPAQTPLHLNRPINFVWEVLRVMHIPCGLIPRTMLCFNVQHTNLDYSTIDMLSHNNRYILLCKIFCFISTERKKLSLGVG